MTRSRARDNPARWGPSNLWVATSSTQNELFVGFYPIAGSKFRAEEFHQACFVFTLVNESSPVSSFLVSSLHHSSDFFASLVWRLLRCLSSKEIFWYLSKTVSTLVATCFWKSCLYILLKIIKLFAKLFCLRTVTSVAIPSIVLKEESRVIDGWFWTMTCS